jgi:hypothetical protein
MNLSEQLTSFGAWALKKEKRKTLSFEEKKKQKLWALFGAWAFKKIKRNLRFLHDDPGTGQRGSWHYVSVPPNTPHTLSHVCTAEKRVPYAREWKVESCPSHLGIIICLHAATTVEGYFEPPQRQPFGLLAPAPPPWSFSGSQPNAS